MTEYHIMEFLEHLDEKYGTDETELNNSYYYKKVELNSYMISVIRNCIIKNSEDFEQNYLLKYFNYLSQPIYKELEDLRMKCNPIGD